MLFGSGGIGLDSRPTRLGNRAINRTLLAPAHVCIGPMLPLVGGNLVRKIDRVANNNLPRGLPQVFTSSLRTIISTDA